MGQTALHIACLWGNASATSSLLTGGADPNQPNQLGGQTPMHMLASRVTNPSNRLACARMMLTANANLKAPDSEGMLPYEYVGGGPRGTKDEDFPELRELLSPTD